LLPPDLHNVYNGPFYLPSNFFTLLKTYVGIHSCLTRAILRVICYLPHVTYFVTKKVYNNGYFGYTFIVYNENPRIKQKVISIGNSLIRSQAGFRFVPEYSLKDCIYRTK
jgi:hypothetical protein